MPPKGVRARSANLGNLQKARDANPVYNPAAPAAPANLKRRSLSSPTDSGGTPPDSAGLFFTEGPAKMAIF